jgi:hypothetical protein
MIKTDMEQLKGTPLAELEPLLVELGFLAGYDEGEQLKPIVSLREDKLVIDLEGPQSKIHLEMTYT